NLRLPAGLAEAFAESTLRALSKCLVILPRADPLLSVQSAFASVHSLVADVRLARGPCSAAASAAFSYQPLAGSAKGFDNPRADECVSELPLSLRGETRLWPDHHVREPTRRENVRTIRLQGFESGRNHQIQSVLSRVGLPQYRHQELGDRRPAFRVLTRPRVTRNRRMEEIRCAAPVQPASKKKANTDTIVSRRRL